MEHSGLSKMPAFGSRFRANLRPPPRARRKTRRKCPRKGPKLAQVERLVHQLCKVETVAHTTTMATSKFVNSGIAARFPQ